MEETSPLALFRRQYFQLVPIRQLQWPAPALIRNAQVQDIIFTTMFDTARLPHVPPERHRLLVLKELLSRIEAAIEDPDEEEVSDVLASAMTILVSSPLASESVAAQQRSYVTYSFPSLASIVNDEGPKITVLEARSVIASSGSTGLRTWEAALHLSVYLCSPTARDLVTHKRVLELGAGTGLLSILCAKYLGASHVLSTDGSAEVVEAIDENLFLNRLDTHLEIQARSFRWGAVLDEDEAGSKESYDVVLGADITYDPLLFPALVSTFREVFRLNPETVILISATVRNEHTFAQFISTCANASLLISDVEFSVPSKQEGPFYSTDVPIRVVRVQNLGAINADPFAL